MPSPPLVHRCSSGLLDQLGGGEHDLSDDSSLLNPKARAGGLSPCPHGAPRRLTANDIYWKVASFREDAGESAGPADPNPRESRPVTSSLATMGMPSQSWYFPFFMPSQNPLAGVRSTAPRESSLSAFGFRLSVLVSRTLLPPVDPMRLSIP